MKDYLIKTMRIMGAKRFANGLVKLFERMEDELRLKRLNILAPIQTKEDGSLLKAKIVFTSFNGLAQKKEVFT